MLSETERGVQPADLPPIPEWYRPHEPKTRDEAWQRLCTSIRQRAEAAVQVASEALDAQCGEPEDRRHCVNAARVLHGSADQLLNTQNAEAAGTDGVALGLAIKSLAARMTALAQLHEVLAYEADHGSEHGWMIVRRLADQLRADTYSAISDAQALGRRWVGGDL